MFGKKSLNKDTGKSFNGKSSGSRGSSNDAKTIRDQRSDVVHGAVYSWKRRLNLVDNVAASFLWNYILTGIPRLFVLPGATAIRFGGEIKFIRAAMLIGLQPSCKGTSAEVTGVKTDGLLRRHMAKLNDAADEAVAEYRDFCHNEDKPVDKEHIASIRASVTKISKPIRLVLLFVGAVKNLFSPDGDAISTEFFTCQELRFLTMLFNAAALVLTAFAIYHLMKWSEIVHFAKDVAALATFKSNPLSVFLSIDHSSRFNSVSMNLFIWSFLAWAISALFAVLLTNRPYEDSSEATIRVLKRDGVIPEEWDERNGVKILCFKSRVSSVNNLVYIRVPGLPDGSGGRLNKLMKRHDLLNDKRGNFRPKQSYYKGFDRDEILITNGKLPEPRVFTGERQKHAIVKHTELYKKHIIRPMRDSVAEVSGSELLYLGEIIDDDWGEDRQAMVDLANNPHLVFFGQPRQGKTKGVQSLIFSFKMAYPNSRFFFIDGKASTDYDPWAEVMSELPVAKYGHGQTTIPLMEFANIVDTLWTIYLQRKVAFQKIKSSLIYDARAKGHQFEQVWCFIDEFSRFVDELGWKSNFQKPGTLSYKISKLVKEAASYGIHLVFISQDYQERDVPANIRGMCPVLIAYAISGLNAKAWNLQGADNLKVGECLVKSPSLNNGKGSDFAKCRFPYIGNDKEIERLIKENVKPIDVSLKRDFRYDLVFSVGANEEKNMSLESYSLRIQSLLSDMSFDVKKLVPRVDAGGVQLSISKVRYVRVRSGDGAVREERVTLIEHGRIGGAILLKNFALDTGYIEKLQEKNSQFQVIILFILGAFSPDERNNFNKTLKDLNELGTVFFKVEYKDYDQDQETVQMCKEDNAPIHDLLLPRIGSLIGIDSSEADSSPYVRKMERVLTLSELTPLAALSGKRIFRGVPVLGVRAPGGWDSYIIFGGATKDRNAKAVELAMDLARVPLNKVILVIMSTLADVQIKKLTKSGVRAVAKERIDELAGESAKALALRGVLSMLDILFINPKQEGTSHIKTGVGARIKVEAKFEEPVSTNSLVNFQFSCEETKLPIFFIGDFINPDKTGFQLPLTQYNREAFKALIPTEARFIVKEGLAPTGTSTELVEDKRSRIAKAKVNLPASCGYKDKDGILTELGLETGGGGLDDLFAKG